MKRYFLTGATGHIGNLVARSLLSQNKEVVCFVLPKENYDELEKLGAKIILGDVVNRQQLFENIKKGDIVIHLAGIISITKSNEDKVYEVNYQGTKNVADACLKAQARFIYTSSVHVLKAIKKGQIDENVGLNDISKRGPYEKSKSMATKYVLNLFNKGLDGVILYPSAIIGPNDSFVGEVSKALIMLYKQKMPAYIKGGYSFVDVRDVANCIVKVADMTEITKTTYILSNKYISIKELTRLVYDHYGYKHIPPYCPLFLVYIGLPFIALHSKIFKTTPIFTRIMLKTVLSNGDFSNKKAKDELGFENRDLIVSIVDSLNWLKLNHPELF